MPDRDPDAPAPAPSLAQRLRGGLTRGGPADGRAWIVAGAVAGLFWAGPIATIVAAHLLTGANRAESTRILGAAQPRIAAQADIGRARAALELALRRPGFAATLEPLARALPRDALLLRAGRGRDGALFIDVVAPDPDAVRAALRRGGFVQLRDAGQRQGETGMVAAFREAW